MCYIGQCKKTNYNSRISAHFHKNDGCSKFWNIVVTYYNEGKNPLDYFNTEIIVDNISTRQMAQFAEKYLIKYYDSVNSGFNTTIGGKNSGVVGHTISCKSRRQISETMRARGHYIRSEEQKRKISVSLKKYYQGRLGTNAFEVVDITTGTKYDSLKSASKAIGCRDSDISNQLKGRQGSVKGHVFKKI